MRRKDSVYLDVADIKRRLFATKGKGNSIIIRCEDLPPLWGDMIHRLGGIFKGLETSPITGYVSGYDGRPVETVVSHKLTFRSVINGGLLKDSELVGVPRKKFRGSSIRSKSPCTGSAPGDFSIPMYDTGTFDPDTVAPEHYPFIGHGYG